MSDAESSRYCICSSSAIRFCSGVPCCMGVEEEEEAKWEVDEPAPGWVEAEGPESNSP